MQIRMCSDEFEEINPTGIRANGQTIWNWDDYLVPWLATPV